MNEEKEIKRKWTTSIFVYALLSVTLGIFGPITLYITNIDEFWFSIGDIWWIIAIGGLVLFSLCILLGLLFKKGKRDIFICLIFGLALAFYIQGNFININYSELNGETINWGSYKGVAVVNTIVWFICMAAPFLLHRYVLKHWSTILKYVSLFILLIQITTIGTLCITTDFNKSGSDVYLSNEEELGLSDNRNVIIFVLDAFDASYFNDVLKEYPEIKSSFKDFTYFPDTVAGATRTTLAMPVILTGKAWTEPISYTEYLEKSYDEAELYDILKENEYDTRIYTSSKLVPSTQSDKVHNLKTGQRKVNSNFLLAKNFYKLTSFRYMPHLLKKYFWLYSGVFNQLQSSNEGNVYKIDDAEYYKRLKQEKLSLDSNRNAFRLYHLFGAHSPYSINEHAQKVPNEETSLLQQARGSLSIVEEYILQVKELGIYDNTTIIIMADHGEIGYEQNGLLLIKGFNESKPFHIDNTPISYFDLHSTLMSIITDDYESYGNTFFDYNEGDSYNRLFYKNASKGNKTKVVEYAINGNAWDQDSISETGNINTGDLGTFSYEYILGTDLIFGSTGNATKYLESGFSADEANHTWNDGNSAEIKLALKEKPKSDLLVKINVGVYSQAGPQRMIVFVGDTIVHNESYLDASVIEFSVPSALLDSNTMLLRFEFPDAVSPSSLGLGDDGRILAFDFKVFSVNEGSREKKDTAPQYMLGNEILFTDVYDGTRYFKYGISGIEKYFAWTNGKYSRIAMNIGYVKGPLVSTIVLDTVFNSEQHVIIKSDDQVLFDKIVDKNRKLISFTIPPECIRDDTVTLDFEYPDAISPYELGLSSDKRELAIAFKSIIFSEDD